MWKWCKTLKIYEKPFIGQCVICLKREILIIDTWNEYIKKSDGIVNLFLYCDSNIRMPLIQKNFKNLMNLIYCQNQIECHQHIFKKIYVD